MSPAGPKRKCRTRSQAYANTPGADKERLKTGQFHGFSVLGVPYSPISGVMVVAYDPVANENAKALLGNVRVHYSATLSGTLINADGAVILTEWDEFRKAEWRDLASLMANPLLVDHAISFPCRKHVVLESNAYRWAEGRLPSQCKQNPLPSKTCH